MTLALLDLGEILALVKLVKNLQLSGFNHLNPYKVFGYLHTLP